MTDWTKAIATWRNMLKNHHEMEEKVLEIMRHPNATSEDIDMVRKVYADSYERMREAEKRIMESRMKPLIRIGNYSMQFPRFR